MFARNAHCVDLVLFLVTNEDAVVVSFLLQKNDTHGFLLGGGDGGWSCSLIAVESFEEFEPRFLLLFMPDFNIELLELLQFVFVDTASIQSSTLLPNNGNGTLRCCGCKLLLIETSTTL